jgi:L-Ala-D/L-Glu epimerase
MRITAVQAEPILGRIRPELAILSSLGDHVVGQYVLVRIETDEGFTGLGEASVTAVWSGETQGGASALIQEVLGPILIGADPFDTEWLAHRMEHAAFGNPFAKAALETALLDIQGKALKLPVSKLLGGRDHASATLRLKFVIGAVEPDTAAQRARKIVDLGWRAIKVKVGRHPHNDVERLRAVRTAIGPEIWLSVDANGGYSVADAIWVAKRLANLDVALFEQPTQRGDHRAMAAVRQRSHIPIMADESVFTPSDALAILRHEAADVLSLYPGKHGGMRATQAIAKMAEAGGVPCTIGSNLEREVATAAMAHVAAATANIQCDRYPGDLIGPLYFDETLAAEPLHYEVDRLQVPAGIGLGLRLKDE